MKQSSIIAIAICTLLFTHTIGISELLAQNKPLTQKQQKKALKNADMEYRNFEFLRAAAGFEKYLSTGINDTAALAKLADCYWRKKKYDHAFRVYKRLFATGKNGATQEQQLRIAEMYARYRDYKQASQWLSGIEGYQSKASAYKDELTLKYMKRDSLNWHVDFLDINTSFDEFSPFIHNDILYYNSHKPTRQQKFFVNDEAINYSRLWKVPAQKVHGNALHAPTKHLQNNQTETKNTDTTTHNIYPDNVYAIGDTSKASSLVKELDKVAYNVGSASKDKHHHFYFCANYSKPDKKQINRLRLMEAVSTGSGSAKIKALPFGDAKSYSVMHPAINRDGTLLVFSSDRLNGKGNYDLYYTQRKSIGQPWDGPKALSSAINTVGNEVFPSITSNDYLYFSSDAMPGLGGLDLYRIPLEKALQGKGKPEHLSYPVNSPGDDFSWTQDSTHVNGYFTSDRLNHNNDIYSFSYKEPVKMYLFDNQLLSKETMKPVERATLFLLNKTDGKVYVAKTNKAGRFRFVIPDAKGAIVKAMCRGFSTLCIPTNAITISLPSDTVLKASKSFAMEELKINYAWKLDVIYYNFDKSSLSTAAIPVLDSLISILKKYPISIEIGSHTDSRGSVAYNNLLSQKRSETVLNYIVQHGIDPSRVIAKGYGKSKLINRCSNSIPCSDEEHKVNRRTEIRVIDVNVDQKSPLEDVDLDQYKDGDVLNKKALPLGFFDECDPDASQN